MATIPDPLFDSPGDLPHTARSNIPFEINPLTPREQWGAGNGSTSIGCRVAWDDATVWTRDMVGEVRVTKPGSTPVLKRFVPEMVQFGDDRPHWCMITAQTGQGTNPDGDRDQPFLYAPTSWPRTRWCSYQAVFEAPPYAIRDDDELATMQAAAGSYAGAIELYRYVIRKRRAYTREQPIPAASTAGGFKVAQDPPLDPPKPVGQIGFRVINMADISYTWVRVPINWPPPIGYGGGTAENPWPPTVNPLAADTSYEYAREKYEGTVNSDWFDAAAPDGYGFAPGTLLYTGYDDSNRYYDAAARWVCDVTFNFRWKGGRDADGTRGTWNHFLDAQGKWRKVTLDGTVSGTPPYASSDFNNLFRYAAS